MQYPLVTIIIPTHNRLKFICRAIDSVLEQSYPSVECLVVDDRSVDETINVLTEKYPNKITLLSNSKNRDKSYSRNKGINNAKGEYIGFLDSDDELTRNSVESRMKLHLDDSQFKGVSFGMRRIANDTEKLVALFKNDYLSLSSYLDNHHLVHTNTYLIPKSSMLEFGMYNESLSNKEDIELFLRLLVDLPFKPTNIVATIIHHDADNRAQHNIPRLLSQNTQFTQEISKNDSLMRELGENFIKLQRQEHEQLLRILYHNGYNREFREKFVEGWKNNISPKTFKFVKRYFVSYIRN